jgi:GTPase SAR1 family protein
MLALRNEYSIVRH